MPWRMRTGTLGVIRQPDPRGMPDELGIADLRFWVTPAYPYLIFYIENSDHIDVWRVLHGQQDIPAWLSE